jgi:hypothetical protein
MEISTLVDLAIHYFVHSMAALAKELDLIRGEEGLGRITVTSHYRGTVRASNKPQHGY